MRQHANDPNAGFDREALEKSEAARARTLLDALRARKGSPDQGNQAKTNPELARLRAALNEAYENRLNLVVRGKNQQEIQRNEAEIRRLATAYDQAEALAREQIRTPEGEVRPLTASELLNTTPDAVILEYALGEKRSYLWRINQGKLTTFLLPGRKAISGAVEKWRDLASARQRRSTESFAAYQLRVQASDRELPKQTAKLSRMLLGGLHANENARLLIIADGSLQSLPFAALLLDGCDRPDGPPLLTSYEVLNSPSLSVFKAGAGAGQPGSSKKDVAILADPVFDASDPRVTKQTTPRAPAAAPSPLQSALRDVGFGSELPRLTATRKEAQAIAAAAPSAKVLLAMDFQANLETALSDELSKYGIWHFATHGLLDTKSPDLSGLVFSLVDSEGRPTPGYLKMQDIFGLSINPDLVVLSACNSGLGEQVDGEGTVGLSYAFLHAGAKQVISTLWNVDDQASSDLMTEFYRGMLSENLSPSAALRKAQNAMRLRKRNFEAFFWAGYVLMSN